MNTAQEMKLGSDIATRFWEDRKSWPAEKAAESFRKEARRLHEEATLVDRGEQSGLPRAWRFAAGMLAVQASHLCPAIGSQS